METYKAKKYEAEKLIVLENSEQLSKLYNTIESEEDFILQWKENTTIISEVIIVTNIASKVKTGEIKLFANEEK